MSFLSTLSLRRATTWARGSRVTYIVSIHALLAESDFRKSCKGISYFMFLSTLSLRRATTDGLFFLRRRNRFYPPSPCGQRPMIPSLGVIPISFLSTPSLRRATLSGVLCGLIIKFLSTLSLRRATVIRRAVRSYYQVSIHALLAESDYLGAR